MNVRERHTVREYVHGPLISMQVVGVELYDHSQTSQLDNSYLDETENQNLAPLPQHAGLLQQLQAQLKTEVTRWIVPVQGH